MAAPEGGTTKERKGKKPHKNKPTGKKYLKYKVSGDKVSRGKMCSRCGAGTFLAIHEGREYCGKCHFTQFIK